MEICVGGEFWQGFCVETKSSDEEFSDEKLEGEVGKFCISELIVRSSEDGS